MHTFSTVHVHVQFHSLILDIFFVFVYLQIFLLPDRCDKSKRRSKTLASTIDPRWGQTFVYSGLRRADLNNRYLEVSIWMSLLFISNIHSNLCAILQLTVWDYVRYGANDFLGEVVLELGSHPLDDEPEWYILHGHQESSLHVSLKHFSSSHPNVHLFKFEISLSVMLTMYVSF